MQIQSANYNLVTIWQREFTKSNKGGKDATKAPWKIYRFRLPT